MLFFLNITVYNLLMQGFDSSMHLLYTANMRAKPKTNTMLKL